MKVFNHLILLCFILIFLSMQTRAQVVNWKKVKVLVYTKNGKGYVHDNIPYAVNCIQNLGKQYGFAVDSSGDPSVMTENNLKQYSLLIFTSTNNDVFDTDDERLAFRHYIEAGGGFVGIHSVTGTERNWKWFKMMLGGTFAWHAKFQKFTIKVIDPSHPSVQGLPKEWVKEDECYFAKELLYPAVWSYDFDGGHTWCTVLGHDKKDYSDPVFMKHIFQGIRYVASQVKGLDFKKAYADTRDTPVRY